MGTYVFLHHPSNLRPLITTPRSDMEYTLGGHTTSVNVVKWGGAGTSAKGVGNNGVLYTASSDRTVM